MSFIKIPTFVFKRKTRMAKLLRRRANCVNEWPKNFLLYHTCNSINFLLVLGRCGGCTVSASGCGSPGNMRSPDGASSWMVGLTSVARPVVPTICQHISHHCSMPQHMRYERNQTFNELTCAVTGSCTTDVGGRDLGSSPPRNSVGPGGRGGGGGGS